MSSEHGTAVDALERRLRSVAAYVDPSVDPALSVGPLLAGLADSVRRDPVAARVWLLATAVAGGFPTQAEVVDVGRRLALAEASGALDAVLAGVSRTASASREPALDAVVLSGATIVDAEFCAKDVRNTGVQRVVRNTMPHWAREHDPVFVAWSPDLSGYRELTAMQRDLVLHFVSGMPAPTDRAEPVLLIPWNSVVLIPEIPATDLLPRQTALARYSGNRVVLVGHDAIPVASADSLVDAESDRYAHYLELLKYSSVVACNSESTAAELGGFVSTLVVQGIAGPRVSAVSLPIDVATPDTATPTSHGNRPLVLTVGTIEPRKNQSAVLSAAELLWDAGVDFELRIIGGGSSTYLEQFDREVRRLKLAGHPVSVGSGVSDAALAQAYADARVVIFPSLQEGYGLPVAEALATGTPAITTNYGSTAGIARGGGCLVVDPRDDEDIAAALRQVLTDDAVYARLVAEAKARIKTSWGDYANALWRDVHLGEAS